MKEISKHAERLLRFPLTGSHHAMPHALQQPCISFPTHILDQMLHTFLGDLQQSAEQMSGVRPELAAGAFKSAYPLPTRKRAAPMQPPSACVALDLETHVIPFNSSGSTLFTAVTKRSGSEGDHGCS